MIELELPSALQQGPSRDFSLEIVLICRLSRPSFCCVLNLPQELLLLLVHFLVEALQGAADVLNDFLRYPATEVETLSEIRHKFFVPSVRRVSRETPFPKWSSRKKLSLSGDRVPPGTRTQDRETQTEDYEVKMPF